MSATLAPLPRSSPLPGRAALLAAAAWALLLAGILLAPAVLPPSDPGDDLTRNTVRLSLLYYALAAALMLRLRPGGWAAATERGRLARACWTLAWAAYLVHVGMALH